MDPGPPTLNPLFPTSHVKKARDRYVFRGFLSGTHTRAIAVVMKRLPGLLLTMACLAMATPVVAQSGSGTFDHGGLLREYLWYFPTDLKAESPLIMVMHGYGGSAQSMRNIRQNLFFAFAYNGAGVPIAAGVLYPLLGTMLSPMLAAAAMSLSSVSVITNALRLRRTSL